MSPHIPYLSTGLPGLDRVFQGLRPGDNIVWQVDSISDYVPFVKPYCENALAKGRRLIYFRFAKHEPLVAEDSGAEIHRLHPEEGFEPFITRIHAVIEKTGEDAFYVFDALSELSLDLYSDRMLGNFYMLTCPYLFALHTVAYYALLKNYHSFHASSPIVETTQILVDVYRHKGKLYVHPRKVENRYSPTMHMLHVWEDDDFIPVTESNKTAEVLTSADWSGLAAEAERPGGWTRSFIQAEETLDDFRRGEASEKKLDEAFHRSLRMAVTDDEQGLQLAKKYFTLSDVLNIKKRMVSSGLIGGKAFGMLLARAILEKTDKRWSDLLEPHDSFYIGSEAFYSFLVNNHVWRLRQKQKNPKSFLDSASEARQLILMGKFHDVMKDRFENLLRYFGQSPIIVRSSSLLEDNFGNAFAGKYDSVFLANQGPRHIRIEDLMAAIRGIYASSMSEEALTYRAERGVLDKDEQMALLVQRVSGIQYGRLFFPQVAGVGFSFNPYAWSKDIDSEAGMIRLVFGLGTRAVERTSDDYTTVVALNAPGKRPHADFSQVREFAQRRVDVLDLEANQMVSMDFVDVAKRCEGLPIDIFASRDEEMVRLAEDRDMRDLFPWVLTFQRLLSETAFPQDMRDMLRILQDAYGSPVDIEFTLNFLHDGRYKINLLQCRTLQIRGTGIVRAQSFADIKKEDLVLESRDTVIGQSQVGTIDRIIYVVPSAYARLTTSDRHEIARLIGQISHVKQDGRPQAIMLIGPGRWGTSTPSLGVPVSFREISPVSVLCEIVAMRDDLVPDVSLGTHFFSDLIERDILYVALFPKRKENFIDEAYFERSPNQLAHLVPDAEKWSNVIRVIDAKNSARKGVLKLSADTMGQRFACYVDAQGA
ncbi:MAG: PEP/pyruvate-binding domain-containing protein [Planctomycetota bacterium]